MEIRRQQIQREEMYRQPTNQIRHEEINFNALVPLPPTFFTSKEFSSPIQKTSIPMEIHQQQIQREEKIHHQLTEEATLKGSPTFPTSKELKWEEVRRRTLPIQKPQEEVCRKMEEIHRQQIRQEKIHRQIETSQIRQEETSQIQGEELRRQLMMKPLSPEWQSFLLAYLMADKPPPQLHKCEYCTYVSVFKESWRRHQVVHTQNCTCSNCYKPSRTYLFQCRHCTFTCRRKFELAKHVSQNHVVTLYAST